MKTMRTMTVLATALLCLACWTPGAVAKESDEAALPERPWEVIEVALVLDTSGSMDGLIDAARLKLWEIVNDLALMEPTPTLRVAILTYGSPWNGMRGGSVKVETDLTQNLDRISDRLFALRSGGGDEFAARVLKLAIDGLSWTPSYDALKLVFLAGNEPADQDTKISLQEVGNLARDAGIFVQVLFCGNADNSDAAGWQELATLAEGRFAAIDFRRDPVQVETPFDEEIVGLGEAMNQTYIPLGEKGSQGLKELEKQDRSARKLSLALAASRAEAKSGRLYSAEWDLVNLHEAGAVHLEALGAEDLPEVLRKSSPDMLEAHIEEMRYQREELRRQIAELASQRREFLAERREAEGVDTSNTFDAVVRQTIREKAAEKGFFFPEG